MTNDVIEFCQLLLDKDLKGFDYSANDLYEVARSHIEVAEKMHEQATQIKAGAFDKDPRYLAAKVSCYDKYIDYTDDGALWRSVTASNQQTEKLVQESGYTWEYLETFTERLPAISLTDIALEFERWYRSLPWLATELLEVIDSVVEWEELLTWLGNGYWDSDRYLYTPFIRRNQLMNLNGFNLPKDENKFVTRLRDALCKLRHHEKLAHRFEKVSLYSTTHQLVTCTTFQTRRGTIIIDW